MESKNRLGYCEVCDNDVAKYCCPRCEVKTCSLSCVNIHKKELDCDGKKYKTGFKRLENFTDAEMSQDYRLMNEFIEAVGEFKMKTQRICNLSPVFRRLRYQAYQRNIRLQILPKSTLNKNNTSFFNHKINKIFWRIDWTFHGTDVKYITHKVPEYQKINNIVRDYFTTEFHDDETKEKMQFYVSAGIKGVIFLMKTPYGKYYQLDSEDSILYSLRYKTILEYPEILIVLSIHKDTFSDLLYIENSTFNNNKSTTMT
ncbi:box C/D snoRNA protein 1 [Aphis gossypii]|uniref:box C/D snoRNA protein 1 n=1 Tax=Aphis gossypii TaxID=80765 RepID=UPI002158C8BE|nr:box C/D snoRNA protein 1 [Aphis gossypii]